jgi:hypothetical protein
MQVLSALVSSLRSILTLVPYIVRIPPHQPIN